MTKQSLNISLQASNLSLGDLEHPNKMPFEGIMTWFNTPSDKPVGGAGGKRVIIPSEFGVPGLASLRGMAVNFDSVWMNKHVSTNKIGIIEDAWVGDPTEDGSVPVYVRGFVYAHDFPEEASQIKEQQGALGFSYETVDTPVVESDYKGEVVLKACEEIVFSGAAILYKDKAAYTNTSLAAQADDKEEISLEIEKIVDAVVSALEGRYELKAKADEPEKEETAEKEEDSKEENSEDEKAEGNKEEEKDEESDSEDKEKPELKAGADEEAEKVDFKAEAEDLKAKLEAATAEIANIKATLKAEADAKEANTHKGFAYPTTLVAKYNLDASAETYDAKIAAVDARTDLNTDEKMALKFELRAAHLKTNSK